MLLLLFLHFSVVFSFTPYVPTGGWTYYIEAARSGTWPSCQYRFASYPGTCDSIDLWLAAGINQQFTFVPVPGQAGTFYLKTSCGRYVSYPGDCSLRTIDTWTEAGVNQAFRFSPSNSGGAYEYFIEALGRQSCDYRWLSFPGPCTTNKPDTLDLWNGAGVDQIFRIHPVATASPVNHHWTSKIPCADPFAWYASTTGQYELLCTSNLLDLSNTPSMGESTDFKQIGEAISGNNMPSWAQPNNRWAPENIHVEVQGKKWEVIVWAQFVAAQNTHRIGWVASSTGPLPNSWSQYAPAAFNLGQAAGGDIDAHVFNDVATNSYYLVWKTDDNSVGMKYTRIWAQKISFSEDGNQLRVNQEGSPVQILDSTGLWWSDSWVAGGSLIEGPEIIRVGSWYYLFFASGRYCEDTYMEGVARSRNVLGPYEKMLIPLLTTGIVGISNGQKLHGPGHASYVQNQSNGVWYSVWHASTGTGGSCVRYPFISALNFTTTTQWPYANF